MTSRILLPALLATLPFAAIGQDQWTQLTSGTTSPLLSISCPDVHTCYTVGGGGSIRKTVDGGTNWDPQESNTTEDLWGVHCPTGQICYAVGVGGVIRKTTNGGTNWTTQTSGTTIFLYDIDCSTADLCVVVGGGGEIRRTTNGGSTWSSVSSGTSQTLHAVQFATSNTVYATGASAQVRESTNGGTSWSSTTGGGVTGTVYGLHFLDANNGWVVGSDGGIYRTTNGGGSWTVQSGDTPGAFFMDVHFVNSSVGYAILGGSGLGGGPTSVIRKTTNGGSSWTSEPLGTNADYRAISFPDTSIAYMVGSNGTILKLTRPVAAAAVPALSAPTHNATDIPVSTSLSWGTSSGAVSYHVQLSTANSFTLPVINDSGLTVTSRSVSGLEQGTIYFWRVRAKNPVGAVSNWSQVRQFTTIPTAPGAPTLVSPADNATDVPVSGSLTWSAVSGAESYRVHLASNPSFSSMLVNTSLSGLSRFYGPLQHNTVYYWRVNATNAGGTGDWSPTRQFTTVPPVSLLPGPVSAREAGRGEGLPFLQFQGKFFDLRGRTRESAE